MKYSYISKVLSNKSKNQRITLFILLLFVLSSCATNPINTKDFVKISNNPDEKFYQTHDPFLDAKLIYHEYRLRNILDSMGVHITKIGDTSRLIASFYYSASNWIFYDSAILINNRGDRIHIQVQKTDREARLGYVFESGRTVLQPTEIESLRNIMNSDNIQLRLTGQYSKDYTISPKQAAAISETIDLYLRGGY